MKLAYVNVLNAKKVHLIVFKKKSGNKNLLKQLCTNVALLLQNYIFCGVSFSLYIIADEKVFRGICI